VIMPIASAMSSLLLVSSVASDASGDHRQKRDAGGSRNRGDGRRGSSLPFPRC
jgi:hypothetical protein